jgi:acetylornithine deacetylase
LGARAGIQARTYRARNKKIMPTDATPDPRSMECIARLIAFDTVSRNSNLELVDWAKSHLEAAGAIVRMTMSEDKRKANLLASFGEGEGGIILSGHTDVVPVDGQRWSSDPFEATVRDGRLYGRGACDMKGFVGVVLGHAPDYAAAAGPVHVALTYDEELGCLGVRPLVEAMASWGIRPAGCVVGEPSGMRPVIAHKGGRVYRCTVTGKAAHSSLAPLAVNAVEYAARLVAFIQSIAERERDGGLRVEGFDVPHTTISVNRFSGGIAGNIVPATADFTFEFRYVPGFDPEGLLAEVEGFAQRELASRMRAVDADAGIAISLVNGIPPLDAKASDAIVQRVRALTPGAPIEKVSYGTEAGFFAKAGVPTVVCGPGSIEQAHKADEFVTLDQLAACDRFVRDLVAEGDVGQYRFVRSTARG